MKKPIRRRVQNYHIYSKTNPCDSNCVDSRCRNLACQQFCILSRGIEKGFNGLSFAAADLRVIQAVHTPKKARFWRGVRRSYRAGLSVSTPVRMRMSGPFNCGSIPRMEHLPEPGGRRPFINLTEVVFPAPFGPKIAETSPSWTEKLKSRRAFIGP